MFKRLLLTIILTLIPALALADDMPTPDSSAPDAASALAPGANSALYPGSSSADSGSLQPAGLSPLQSTTQDSNGLTSPTAGALQAPVAGSSDLQVIAGDADGTTHQLDDGPNLLVRLAPVLIAALVAAGAFVIARDRRRFGRNEI